MKKKINAGSVDELFEIVNAVQKGEDPEEYLNERRKEQKAEAEAKAAAQAQAQKAAEEEAAARKAAEEKEAAAKKSARREEAADKRAAMRKDVTDRIAARRAEREKSRAEKQAAKPEETKPEETKPEETGASSGQSLQEKPEEPVEGTTRRPYKARTVSSEAEHVGNRILRSLHMEHIDEAPSEEDVEELVKDLPIRSEEEEGAEEVSEKEQTAGTEVKEAAGTEELSEPEESELTGESAGPAPARKGMRTIGRLTSPAGGRRSGETQEAEEPRGAENPQDSGLPPSEMIDLMTETEPAGKNETDKISRPGEAGQTHQNRKHFYLAAGIAAAVIVVLLVVLATVSALNRSDRTAQPEEETDFVLADDRTASGVTAEKSDGAITIKASDEGSGVDAIWYAAVSDDGLIEIPEYQKYTAPIPYHSGQTYYFYAVDKAGNTSEPAVTRMDTSSYPPVPGEAAVTISAVGDCTLGSAEGSASVGSFPAYAYSYGYSYFFQNVRDIFENDDVTFANLEGPLTTTSTYQDKEYVFKGDPSYTDILKDGSIEVVTLANNHTSDYGAKGLADTEEALTEADIGYCIGSTVDYQDVDGVTVAFIGIYEEALGSAYEQDTRKAITQAQENGAQLIIVAYHWGEENATAPSETQREIAHEAIDMGADLVVGHHPHVLQGIEKYNGKYIVYSLGNFCFGGNTSPSDTDTMIFRQTFTVSDEGVALDDDIEIIPCTISTTDDYNDFCPTPATGGRADEIMERINSYSAAFGDITYTASTGL